MSEESTTPDRAAIRRGFDAPSFDETAVYAARYAMVFTVRNGKLARLCLYQEAEDALKAVGLSE